MDKHNDNNLHIFTSDRLPHHKEWRDGEAPSPTYKSTMPPKKTKKPKTK
ncbi:MAG: hypothetical protein LKJ25_00840 [Clostridia bacterium]|jgi:hypothetical protein|nr:hypothetical protein [Clostridia bacterium]